MKNGVAPVGVSLFAVLFATTIIAAAQQGQTTIKKEPIKTTSPGSGEEMFKSYCASCHGVDAKGNGPAAPALKVSPPDLTLLAQRNGGKYPGAHVEAVLRFGAENYPVHGSKDMPVWGPALASISGGLGSGQTAQRIHNLSQYIETLQVK